MNSRSRAETPTARRARRGDVFWTPERLFAGRTVFILASGPSLADIDLSRLKGRSTITINSSAMLAAAAGLDDGVLFCMDTGWWRRHRALCEAWRGPIVTMSRAAKAQAPQLVRRARMMPRAQPDFPPRGSPLIRWGRSSGHVAISLAVAMGAVVIVLLGYDMRLVGDRSHHHNDYDRVAHPSVYTEFLRHFEGWNKAALEIGVTVLNATPGSALTEFEPVDLAQILGDARMAA